MVRPKSYKENTRANTNFIIANLGIILMFFLMICLRVRFSINLTIESFVFSWQYHFFHSCHIIGVKNKEKSLSCRVDGKQTKKNENTCLAVFNYEADHMLFHS